MNAVCALTPAQAHDRPLLPLMPVRSGFVNEVTNRSAEGCSRTRGHCCAGHVKQSVAWLREPLRSNKALDSKTLLVVRRTTRPNDNGGQAAENEMKGPNPVTTDSVGLQISAKDVSPGTGASAETGAVALAFISRKRGTVLVRCTYKVCDPLPP